jgi:hypothetical protein
MHVSSSSFLQILLQGCQDAWPPSRRRCACVSVSGLPCVKRAGHRQREREREREAAGGGGDEEGGDGEEEECSSGLAWLGVSGCGKRRRMRRDPFTLWEANHRFYQECVAELDGMFRV